MANNAMKNFTDLVMKALDESEEKESLKWVKPWSTIDSFYRNAFTGHKYKGLHNVLTCLLEGRSDPRYATFNQIRKAGGKVKKGSKSTRLIAWKITPIIEADKKTGKDKKKNLIFAREVCVFNVEDCEGLKLKPINTQVLNENIKPNELVEELFKKHNVKIVNQTSNSAFYNPHSDEIILPLASQFKSSNEWSATALHELVHWTAKRVDRECKNYSFDVEERSMEELVAELGAMFLCMNLRIDGYMDKNNLAYIKSWKSAAKGKNGERFIYKACSLAEKACKFLIGDVLNTQEENPEPELLEAAE